MTEAEWEGCGDIRLMADFILADASDRKLRLFACACARTFWHLLTDWRERILGFAMIGPEAGEVTAVVQTAMLGKLPYTLLREAILTHPTMAEGLNGLFAAVPAARFQKDHPNQPIPADLTTPQPQASR
jgi:hypothetical protein